MLSRALPRLPRASGAAPPLLPASPTRPGWGRPPLQVGRMDTTGGARCRHGADDDRRGGSETLHMGGNLYSQGYLFPEAQKVPARDATASSFVDNLRLPVHRWFRYSAGFSAP